MHFHVPKLIDSMRLFRSRSRKIVKTWREQKRGIRSAVVCVIDVITVFWRYLRSIVVKTHSNMKSFRLIKKQNIVNGDVINASVLKMRVWFSLSYNIKKYTYHSSAHFSQLVLINSNYFSDGCTYKSKIEIFTTFKPTRNLNSCAAWPKRLWFFRIFQTRTISLRDRLKLSYWTLHVKRCNEYTCLEECLWLPLRYSSNHWTW